MAEDNKRLIPMTIRHIEDDLWEISIDGCTSYKVNGEIDDIKRVCRRIKAKDGDEHGKCRSSKIGTYKSMFSDQDNNEHKINVWKSKVPHSSQEFLKLMENNAMSKSVKLTKNYIIEGVIYKKGTILEFKEKLDFLPSDIWEKAQDIKDEHERFEFIKAELNKLGDDYSDDEISDFINKYKNELNESKLYEKLDQSEIDIMIDVLKETIESEDTVDPSKYDEVLKKAEKDTKLLNAWEALSNADDKTFIKKENAFWNAFDELCKPYKK